MGVGVEWESEMIGGLEEWSGEERRGEQRISSTFVL